MPHSTVTSSADVLGRVEGWFDSVYSDVRDYLFGPETTTTGVVPTAATATGPQGVATASAAAATSVATGAASAASSAASLSPGSPAAPSVVTVTQTASPTAAITQTVTYFEPTTGAAGPVGTSLPVAPTSTATASSHHSNVNAQTLGIAALGALVVILIYLVSPVLVRLLQFVVNATRLLFHRSDSFAKDSEMGLSSDTFSLTANIDCEDQRQGLDKKTKLRIMWYMLRYGETFDEARLRHVLHQFASNGIGPEGEPLDPKHVTFAPSPMSPSE